MEQVLSAAAAAGGQQHVHVKAELPDDEPSIAATADDYMDFHQIFGARPDGTMRAEELPEQMIAHLSHAYPELEVQSFAHHSRPFHAYSSHSSASSNSSKSDPSSSSAYASAASLSEPPDHTDPTYVPAAAATAISGCNNDNNDDGDGDSTGAAKKKRFACPECGKLFGRVSHVRRHQLLHTGNKPFGCSVCGDRFTRVENRDRHMIMHTEQRPYNCEQCGKGFTQLNRLKVHRLTHTGERPFECEVCAKRFLRVDHLRVHMRTHRESVSRGEEVVAVEVTVTEVEQVQEQQQMQQKEEQPQLLPSSLILPVAVEAPAEVFEHGSQPEIPATVDCTAITGLDKPFQCGECPKQFARRDHFMRHVAVHSGERPFSCDLCPKSFSRKDNKYSHMVGCLLKNYSVSVDCGGELPRGMLQRTVDERVRDVLGDAYIEPETQLQEEQEEAVVEVAAVEKTEEELVDWRQRGDSSKEDEHEERGDHSGVLVECDSVQDDEQPIVDRPSSPAPCAAPPPPICLLKVRSLNEMAACPLVEPDQCYAPQDADIADDEPTNYSTSGVCDSALSSSSQSLPSQQQQQQRRLFRCDVCDKPFQNKSHLVRHAALHTSDRPFRCDQCDKAFNRKEHLQRHVIVHTGIKPFRCAFCDRAFVEQNQQRRHVQEEHAAEAEAAAMAAAATAAATEDEISVGDDTNSCVMDSGEAVAGADGLYHCDRCDRSYAVKFRLRRHYAQHTGDKAFQCDYCEQRFSRAEHKRRHMAIHTNEKRFECEFCERRFIRADHMLAHVKTHEGVLPYKCTVCAHRFATAKQKMEHMRRHTGAYRCEMCLERFESFGDLSEHRRDIHLQAEQQQAETVLLVGRRERYPCPVCKKYYGIGRLGDHLKEHVAPEMGESDDDDEEGAVRGSGGRVYADGMPVDLGRLMPKVVRYADDERCGGGVVEEEEERERSWTAMKVECCDGGNVATEQY